VLGEINESQNLIQRNVNPCLVLIRVLYQHDGVGVFMTNGIGGMCWNGGEMKKCPIMVMANAVWGEPKLEECLGDTCMWYWKCKESEEKYHGKTWSPSAGTWVDKGTISTLASSDCGEGGN